MAEALAAIGVLASLTQLADYGLKLSIKLFTFGEAVSNADKSIKNLSNEVSLTSAVLKELESILRSEGAQYVSERAVEATEKTVQECFEVYNQLNKLLEKILGEGNSERQESLFKIKTLDKIKWPFLQPKFDLQRANLDRLKASLALMLQVLVYAKDISNQ
jgi:hypothetical protein